MKTVINIYCAIFWSFVVCNFTWIITNCIAPVIACLSILAVVGCIINIGTILTEVTKLWE